MRRIEYTLLNNVVQSHCIAYRYLLRKFFFYKGILDSSSSGSELGDSQSSETSNSDEEKEHIGSLRYKNDLSTSEWHDMQQKVTIVIIHIALMYMKEPITVADLLRLGFIFSLLYGGIFSVKGFFWLGYNTRRF